MFAASLHELMVNTPCHPSVSRSIRNATAHKPVIVRLFSARMSAIDFHSHNIRCGHADNTIAEMAQAAINSNITIFGHSDHAPLFAHEEDHPLPDTQMAKSDWHDYLTEMETVRTAVQSKLDMRLGTEADYLPGTEAAYRQALEDSPLDFVIGSIHNIGPVHIYKQHTHELITDVDELHRNYWDLTRQAVESGLFDVLAHMDAARVRLPAPQADMTHEVNATLDCIADNGITVEINSGGARKTSEMFPAASILEGLVNRNVPITFGSDSHRASEVGDGYQQAAALLTSLGVTRWATFRDRRRDWTPIE